MWACRCYHVLIGLNLVQQATEHSPSLSPTHTHTHKPNTKGRRQGSTENKHAREFKPLYDERRFLSWPVLFFLFSSLTAFSKILIVPLKHYIAGIYLLCHECFYLSSKALMTVSLDISPSIFTKKHETMFLLSVLQQCKHVFQPNIIWLTRKAAKHPHNCKNKEVGCLLFIKDWTGSHN